ncbi:uncharacterized protein [Gossypium hirsutum]|uniref:Uncharacterized protein isoform X2 n=1 Tax=Gossypium hirsutum TaxID=3635 RepID=A0ABM3BU64_GOSHI|nr:uncharacterized protein LOC121229800 isoform X2 [Gossypium hirsutum]
MILFFMVVESCAKVYFQPRSHRYNPSVHIHPSFRQPTPPDERIFLLKQRKRNAKNSFCNRHREGIQTSSQIETFRPSPIFHAIPFKTSPLVAHRRFQVKEGTDLEAKAKLMDKSANLET